MEALENVSRQPLSISHHDARLAAASPGFRQTLRHSV